MRYRCIHCGEDLGPVIDGQPEPNCPNHLCGMVEIRAEEG